MRAIYRFFRNFAFVNTSLSKKSIGGEGRDTPPGSFANGKKNICSYEDNKMC